MPPRPSPNSDFPQAQTAHDNFWDFISLTPESMHMIMWAMSDRAIPRSLRFMEGFGVHTFRLLNANDESTFVKFLWKPKLGLQSVAWNEAVKINGADPDFHRRDLWDAIHAGNFPEWELQLQLFDQAFADSFDFDILDPTKLIPEEVLPPIAVGRLVLDRMPDNFFAETEQVAFMTQNVPPGIDFSNDPLLQGRNFSYLDTQIKRLGSTNFTHIPINAPKCPFHNFQQDGHMAMRNPVGRANYQPNSWDEGPRELPAKGFRSFAEVEAGPKARLRSETFADHYSQARQFYISQQPVEQGHIASALTFELSKVQTPVIRERIVSHLLNIDDGLAGKVADALGLKAMPKPADAAVPTRQDLAGVGRAQHPQERPRPFRGPQARHPGDRRNGCRPAECLEAGADQGRRKLRDHRAEGRRRQGQRRQLDRRATDDRRRTVGSLRRRGAAAGKAGHGRPAEGIRRPATSSPTPSRIASSSASSRRRRRCCPRPALPRTRRLSRLHRPRTFRASSQGSARCAGGRASRR